MRFYNLHIIKPIALVWDVKGLALALELFSPTKVLIDTGPRP